MCNILNNCDADFKAYLDSGLWSILESWLPLDFGVSDAINATNLDLITHTSLLLKKRKELVM